MSIVNPTDNHAVVSVSAGNGQSTYSPVKFANSNGVSWSVGTQGVYASVDAVAGGGGAAISGGANSQSTGTVNFANSNGITFGLSNNGTMTASHNGLTTAALSDHSHGVTLNLTNLSGTTGGNSNGITLSLSANAQSVQPVAASAANGSFAFSTLSFSNLNGISFGTSAGSAITASHNALTSQSNQALSAANGSFTFQTATFANSNGVSFSTGTQGLYASHNGLTSQSNQAFSAAGGSSAFQTLSFADSNGVSFSNSNGSVVATVATNYAASNHSHGNPTLNLTNLSGTTASASNGLTLSLSAAAPVPIATQVYDVASAGSTGTVTRYAPEDHRHAGVGAMAAGSNTGTTLGDTMSKHGTWVLAVSGNGTLSGSTGAGGVHTAWISIPNAAASPVGVSAGTTSSNLATINFADSNGVSFGLNGATITGSVNTSYAASNHSHGNPTLNLTNLSGTTASNSAGFTLSLSAAAAGGGVTMSGFNPLANCVFVTAAHSNASLIVQPVHLPAAVQFDRVVMPLQFTQATNSTLTVTNSVWYGFYTKNDNTMSLYTSGSGTFSINGSGTASSSANSGIRLVSFDDTETISAGNYYLGVVWRTTTAGANATLQHIVASNIASTFSGWLGVGSATNVGFEYGRGVWTSTTAGMPNSLAFSDVRQNSSAYLRPPVIYFTSGSTG